MQVNLKKDVRKRKTVENKARNKQNNQFMSLGPIKFGTLQIRRLPVGTLLLALLLGAGILLACEVASRFDAVSAELPPPSVGCGHQQLDTKLEQLELLAKTKGRVDCLIFGNSMVFRDIDPAVMVSAYRQQTGNSIVCYNFGLMGLSEPAAAPLARALVNKYRPRLLIFGSSPGSMDEDVGKFLTKRILANPWILYHQGEFSLDGWLIEHSRAYRHYIGHRYLSRQRSEVRLKKIAGQRKRIGLVSTEFGYADTDIIRMESMADLEGDDPLRDGLLLRKLKKYRIDAAHLDALEQILALDRRIPVLMLEMPYHPRLMEYLPDAQPIYDDVIGKIDTLARRHQVLFLRSQPLRLVSDEGWFDLNHMNGTGARIFSRWLGEQLGQAVRDGKLKDPALQE